MTLSWVRLLWLSSLSFFFLFFLSSSAPLSYNTYTGNKNPPHQELPRHGRHTIFQSYYYNTKPNLHLPCNRTPITRTKKKSTTLFQSNFNTTPPRPNDVRIKKQSHTILPYRWLLHLPSNPILELPLPTQNTQIRRIPKPHLMSDPLTNEMWSFYAPANL